MKVNYSRKENCLL